MNIYFRRIINAVIASAFTCYFGVYSLVGGVNKQPPEVPEDFTPVLRFAVCSDVHLSGEENQANAKRFTALYNDTYDYAATQSYKGFDAVIVAGDMTGGGREPEYEMFMKIINDNTVGDTQTLVCMGNHEFIEYRDYDATIGYDVYKKFCQRGCGYPHRHQRLPLHRRILCRRRQDLQEQGRVAQGGA